MKRVLFFAMLNVLCFGFLYGQAFQLKNVAVLDLQRVNAAFSRNTTGQREYEQAQRAFDARIDELRKELEELITRINDANQRGDQTAENNLRREYATKLEASRSYSQTESLRLENQRRALSQSVRFTQQQLDAAIRFVAVREGYTIVLDKNTPGILMTEPASEITDMVINRLQTVLR